MKNYKLDTMINDTELFKNNRLNLDILNKKFFQELELFDINDFNVRSQEVNIICRFTKTKFNNFDNNFVAKIDLYIGRLDSTYFNLNKNIQIINNNIIIYMVSDILPNIFVTNPLLKDWDDELPFTTIPSILIDSDRSFHIFICKVNYLQFFDNFKDIMSGAYFKKLGSDYLNEVDMNNIRAPGYKTLKTIIESSTLNSNVLIPTFVFKGKPWSFIIAGCLRNGINISGGSVTRRHKLNRSTIELVLFMLRFNLIQNNENIKYSYIENLFTRNSLDKKFYNDIISIGLNKDVKKHRYSGFEYDRFYLMLFIESLFTDIYSRMCLECKKILINLQLINKLNNYIKATTDFNKIKDIKLDIEILEKEQNELIENITALFSEANKILGPDFISEDLKVKYNNMLHETLEYYLANKLNTDSLFLRKGEDYKSVNNKNDSNINNIKNNREYHTYTKLDICDNKTSYNLLLSQANRMKNRKFSTLIQSKDLTNNEIQNYHSNKGSTITEIILNNLLSIIHLGKEITDIQLDLEKFSNNSYSDHLLNRHKKLFRSGINFDSNNNFIINSRNYHSLINRNYSNYLSNKKLNLDIDSPIFLELQRIILNSPIDNHSQIKIEKFLINQGAILLSNRFNELLDINYYKLNSFVLNYLRSSVEDIEKLLNNYKKNISNSMEKEFSKEILNILKYIDNKTIISYLLGRVLKIISNNNLINKNTISVNVAIDLAKELVNSYILIEYKNYLSKNLNKNYNIDQNGNIDKNGNVLEYENNKNNIKIDEYEYINMTPKYTLSDFKIDNKENFKIFENDKFLFTFGIQLLNILEEVKIIKTNIEQLKTDQKQTILVLDNKISSHIKDNLKFLGLPYKIPMIVKPKKYSIDPKSGKEILGGYLLNDKEIINPLIIKNSELKDQSVIDKNNYIYNMINNMNSVGFKINQDVLDFIINYGLKFNLIIDPDFSHELEIKKNNNKNLNLKESKELESFLSKKYLERNILGLAIIFKNVSEFFIPVRIDNRGRVYCTSDYLNYQSIELAKSLLLFSKGEKIFKNDTVALEFLKIYGANCFGNGIDKKSYNDRIKWIKDNEDNILDFNNGLLINKAESKLLFIAFCFEYRNYKNSLFNNDNFYISHFPIQLDATCNGFQHLALLTGDDPLASNLNLKSSTYEKQPNDFYMFITIKLKEFFKKKILELQKLNDLTHEDSEKLNSYIKLIKLNIHRKLVKLGVMVKPYNASFYQISNYIKENLVEIKENGLTYFCLPDNKDIKLTNKDINKLTQAIDIVIYNEYPKLLSFVNYLKSIAKICSILNIPIVWAAPSGLNITQYYIDSEAIRLKPFYYKKFTYTLLIGNNKLNKSKQIRALMPNLIHSLDAASLALLTNLFFEYKESDSKILNFFSIHDCFAVTANNVSKLFSFIQLVYINIYSNNQYIKKFDQGIIDNIKLQFGNNSFDEVNKKITVNNIVLKYPDINEVISGKIEAYDIKNSSYIIN